MWADELPLAHGTESIAMISIMLLAGLAPRATNKKLGFILGRLTDDV